MKKKNKKNVNTSEVTHDHLQNQLKRHKERLEKEEQKKEKSRNALFRRRVREASVKKAPKTLRTKAYYRFSKDYPAAVTPDGFRENNPEKETLSFRKKTVAVILCIAVFLTAITATKTALLLSSREPVSTPASDNASSYKPSEAMHFTASQLSSLTADEMLSSLRESNCTAAVFDFKDEYGYVYFDINSFSGASADKKIADAWDKVLSLKASGITLIAYISCFKDSVAAASVENACVKTELGEDYIDSNNRAWINPLAIASSEYLSSIIKKAAEGGFDNIILDNICFPTDIVSAPPVFGYGSITNSEKLSALTAFIDRIISENKKCNISVMTLISGIYQVTQSPSEKYGGRLTESSCKSFVVDLRAEYQDSEITKNSLYFNYVTEMPSVFMLDAAAFAKKTEEINGVNIVALSDADFADGRRCITDAKIGSIIYW